ncbi:hypothetical protein RB595_008233 [Gaeumannomyces hyphopodioides]
MCYQINYMLPCEHVRTHIVYCADAPPAPTASEWTASEWPSSSAGPRAEKRSKGAKGLKSRGGSSSSNSSHHHHVDDSRTGRASSSYSPTATATTAAATTTTTTATAVARRPCRNLTQQSLPYPTPPSFAASPTAAASSPLLPKCPLERCPFEERNRCWNCCWCGKQCNDTGRCRCVMIIEGNQVECEHICCGNCTAA